MKERGMNLVNDRVFSSKEELFAVAETSIGKKIGTYDYRKRLVPGKGKGKIGLVLEEGLFGHFADKMQKPDFENLGIELKVTGYRWTHKNTRVSAKERLVITMIDYLKDPLKLFRESNVYHKIAQMLLLLYEYEEEKVESEFLLTNYYFYEFDKINEKDKSIIIDDYERIIEKISNGKAHEISEGDTFYLGACTKGANRNSTVLINGISVMKRAYAFKPSYMTYLMRTSIFKQEETKESFVKNIQLLKRNSLEELIYGAFKEFESMTLSEIDKQINKPINRVSNKQYLRNYVSSMLNVGEKNLNNIEEFQKANIQIKTVRISRKGRIKESMSFPSFDFIEVSQEEWNESETRDIFENSKFLFVIFDEIDDVKKEYKFRKIKLWNMPNSILDTQVKAVWEATKNVLNNEVILDVKNGSFYNNFPSSRENDVSHVRPHGIDSSDTNPLPDSCRIVVRSTDGSKDTSDFVNRNVFTKQSFWFNSSFILDVLNDNEGLYTETARRTNA